MTFKELIDFVDNCNMVNQHPTISTGFNFGTITRGELKQSINILLTVFDRKLRQYRKDV